MKTASELEDIIMIKELKIKQQNLEIERQKEIIRQLDIKNLELTTIIKEVREYILHHCEIIRDEEKNIYDW